MEFSPLTNAVGRPGRRLLIRLLAALILTSLSASNIYAADDPKNEEFLKAVQARFDGYPQLRQYGFRVKVLSFTTGILTLTTSKLPETNNPAQRANLEVIWQKLMSIAEQLAKRYPEVTNVVWINEKDMVAPSVNPMAPSGEPATPAEISQETASAEEEKKKVEKPNTNIEVKYGYRTLTAPYWGNPPVNKQSGMGVSINHMEKNWRVSGFVDILQTSGSANDEGITYTNKILSTELGMKKIWLLKDSFMPSIMLGGTIVQITDEGTKAGVSQGRTIDYKYGYVAGAGLQWFFEGFSIGVEGKQAGGTADKLGDYTGYAAVIGWGF